MMSLTPHLDAHTLFDPRRNLDRFFDLGLDDLFAVTGRTFFYDLLASTVTGRTWS